MELHLPDKERKEVKCINITTEYSRMFDFITLLSQKALC